MYTRRSSSNGRGRGKMWMHWMCLMSWELYSMTIWCTQRWSAISMYGGGGGVSCIVCFSLDYFAKMNRNTKLHKHELLPKTIAAWRLHRTKAKTTTTPRHTTSNTLCRERKRKKKPQLKSTTTWAKYANKMVFSCMKQSFYALHTRYICTYLQASGCSSA